MYKATVSLIGTGFLGSLFTLEVAKRAFALHTALRLRLFDPDTVQERNVANQLYHPRQQGQKKVAALSKELAPYRPLIETLRKDFKVDENSKLSPCDYIVCATDNIESRCAAWTLATKLSVPLLSLGIDQQGGGDVSWYVPTKALDDVPFSPIKNVTQPPVNVEVESLPPCELIRFRDVGQIVAVTGARALFLALGFDPEKYMGDKFPALGGFSKWFWKGQHFEFGGLVV